jgi:uncharacterized protein (TIGR03067 family)
MLPRFPSALAIALLCAGATLLPAAQDKGDQAKGKSNADQLQGTWNFVLREEDGTKLPRVKGGDFQTITFQGDKFEVKQGNTVVFAGTHKLDPAKNPKTIDLTVTGGDGKGTVQLGIYELQGDTLKACFDPKGKKRPAEFATTTGSGTFLTTLQRELKAGVDPRDASVVYDKPWQMNSGFKAYNGKAYDKAALCVGPKAKVVVPDKDTEVRPHDQADVVLICMEKRINFRAHFVKSVNITDYRGRMGCAVKLEKGALLIGTFGEFNFFEGACAMRLLVLVPPKVEVEKRVGLIGGYGGRGGSDRPPELINPTREDPKPALTKMKKGPPDCWLPRAAEDGWHEIPAVADVEQRVGKEGKEKG